jgi:hypothetical protein
VIPPIRLVQSGVNYKELPQLMLRLPVSANFAFSFLEMYHLWGSQTYQADLLSVGQAMELGISL